MPKELIANVINIVFLENYYYKKQKLVDVVPHL